MPNLKQIQGRFPIAIGEYYNYQEELRQQICVPTNSGDRLEIRSAKYAQDLIDQIRKAVKELGWEEEKATKGR